MLAVGVTQVAKPEDKLNKMENSIIIICISGPLRLGYMGRTMGCYPQIDNL